MKGKIYILKDPKTSQIRYVGMTKLSLKHRLSLHMSEKKKITHKSHWINSLKSKKLKPVIEKIDESNNLEELSKKEIYWINYYLKKGYPLTNYVTTFSTRPYKDFLDKTAKKVIQYDLKGNIIAEYESGMDAACELGDCNANPTIYSICNGKNKYTYKGFVFRFKGDSFDKYKIVKPGVHKTTEKHKKYLSKEAKLRNKKFTKEHYSNMGKISALKKARPFVCITTGKEYNTIEQAIKETGFSRKYFTNHLKNRLKKKKSLFKYKDIV